jgi:ankyrin repeat protein
MPPDEQEELDRRLISAAMNGQTETVRALLAAGADVHATNDSALCSAACWGHTEVVKALLASGADVHAYDDEALRFAAYNGHTEIVKVLLASGADVHARDDEALRWAARNGRTGTLRVLTRHIFARESWRGKSRAEIEAQANALYDKIKGNNPSPEHLHKAGTILADCALTCWEQVRPPPPKLTLSPFPAQPRPL